VFVPYVTRAPPSRRAYSASYRDGEPTVDRSVFGVTTTWYADAPFSPVSGMVTCPPAAV
jgi:hypothetical protein